MVLPSGMAVRFKEEPISDEDKEGSSSSGGGSATKRRRKQQLKDDDQVENIKGKIEVRIPKKALSACIILLNFFNIPLRSFLLAGSSSLLPVRPCLPRTPLSWPRCSPTTGSPCRRNRTRRCRRRRLQEGSQRRRTRRPSGEDRIRCVFLVFHFFNMVLFV